MLDRCGGWFDPDAFDLELVNRGLELPRDRQIDRFAGQDIPFNAAIPGGHVRDYCDFSTLGFDEYKKCIENNTLSTRSMDRLAKVSRTIADLVDSDQVEPKHVTNAASYVVGGMLREGIG